jgi:hypothetical protein
VLGEQSLRRILRSYFACHHDSRCHLALDKDSPQAREVQPADKGMVVEIPIVWRASSSLRATRSPTDHHLSRVKPSRVAIVERGVYLKLRPRFHRAPLCICAQPKWSIAARRALLNHARIEFSEGTIAAIPQVSGLHHRYERGVA